MAFGDITWKLSKQSFVTSAEKCPFNFVLYISSQKRKRALEKRTNPVVAQKAVDMGGKMAEKQMETLEKQKGKVDTFLGEEVCHNIQLNNYQYLLLNSSVLFYVVMLFV